MSFTLNLLSISYILTRVCDGGAMAKSGFYRSITYVRHWRL